MNRDRLIRALNVLCKTKQRTEKIVNTEAPIGQRVILRVMCNGQLIFVEGIIARHTEPIDGGFIAKVSPSDLEKFPAFRRIRNMENCVDVDWHHIAFDWETEGLKT